MKIARLAPYGGKSVLMYELGNYDITSCDIYQHKLELMRGYAKKLGAEIKVKLRSFYPLKTRDVKPVAFIDVGQKFTLVAKLEILVFSQESLDCLLFPKRLCAYSSRIISTEL